MRAYRLLTTLLAPLARYLLARRRAGGPLKFSKPGFSAPQTASENPEKAPFSAQKRPIWLHCASAGEVVAAQTLIEALLAQEKPVLVSLWSPNGLIKLRQLFDEAVPWAWLPWDAPSDMRRFIERHRPQALWVLETEIWPNMLQAASQAGVPITYVNGRLTDKTLRAPGWLRAAYQAGLSQVEKVLARSEADAERFRRLGVPAQRIEVAGNLKWLAAARLIEQPPAPLRNAPYVLFASAYEDEIDGLMPLLAAQEVKTPWVIVPRRPDRDAEYVRATAEEQGLSVAMIETDAQAAEARADILVETRFGNLTAWMAGAQAVIMGGSFAPYGGHNFLEAAALGKPVIVGEDMSDFEEETALFLKEGALIQCDSFECALETLPQASPTQGEQARALLETHAGAMWQRYRCLLGLAG